MSASIPNSDERAIVRRVYDADEVARITGLGIPTVYERARAAPQQWGVIREGRSVRFLRSVIDRRYPPPLPESPTAK